MKARQEARSPVNVLDKALTGCILQRIRNHASGRHVPDAIVQVADVPRTLSGKKMEVPVRRLLLGTDPAQVASPGAMQKPASLAFFIDCAKQLNSTALQRAGDFPHIPT